MARIRLLGQGIGYSASVAMQSAALEALGLRHRYELADVTPDRLADTVVELRQSDHLGANVTTPHKGAVLPLLDEVEPLAVRAQAVNTILNRGGRLLGFNTDIPALVDEIRALRPEPRRAVVLGAGGAARAVSLALQEAGAGAVTLVSRSATAGASAWDRLPELLAEAEMLVNATPVGTNSDESPVPAAYLHRQLAVLDLVYRPSPTRLVREARAAGAPARAGAGVLLGQGWRSLEIWLERAAPRDVMAQALGRKLGAGADVQGDARG